MSDINTRAVEMAVAALEQGFAHMPSVLPDAKDLLQRLRPYVQ